MLGVWEAKKYYLYEGMFHKIILWRTGVLNPGYPVQLYMGIVKNISIWALTNDQWKWKTNSGIPKRVVGQPGVCGQCWMMTWAVWRMRSGNQVLHMMCWSGPGRPDEWVKYDGDQGVRRVPVFLKPQWIVVKCPNYLDTGSPKFCGEPSVFFSVFNPHFVEGRTK